jgi:hypothetical protein
MTAQRRLSGALALTCICTALTPAVAGAMPAPIDPPATQHAGATACEAPAPRAATADCGASSDFDAAAIALVGGGVLLVGGGLVAGTTLRHRREGQVAVTRP